MTIRAVRHFLIALVFVSGLSVAVWEALPETKSLVGTAQTQSTPLPHSRLGQLSNLYVAYVAPDGRLFGIDDHIIFLSRDRGRTFERIGMLPKIDPSWQAQLRDRIGRSKLARTLRSSSGPTNVVVLASGTMLVFYDHIYRSTDNGRTFSPVYSFAGEQMSQGFSYSEGIAVGPDDRVYFGEYTTSARPHAIRIVEGRADGTDWKVAYIFPSGEIFHVHAIQYDPFREGYWVTTGDLDTEAKVLFTGDHFRSFHTLGQGSQDWRAVSLLIQKGRLVWGSDNDRAPASIFEWDFATSTLRKLQEIGKPSYYSTALADGTLVLSTTYEPESPYTRVHHPEPSTDLWIAPPGGTWTKLLSLPYEKEMLPWGPSRAAIAFPGGKPSQALFYTPISTGADAFATHVIQFSSDTTH